MHKIIKKFKVAEDVYLMEFEAQRIAAAFKPGQFIILRIHEKGEKVPFSICNVNKDKGTITIVFKNVGETTNYMSKLEEGQFILDAVGPLGHPSPLFDEDNLKQKKVLFVSEDSASARIYTELKYLHDISVHSEVLLSFKNKERVMFTDKIKALANKTYESLEAGSGEYDGKIENILEKLLDNGDYSIIVCMGSTEMMKNVCSITKARNIKTIVSLNVLMLDGTGMCGACRVNVGGEIKFACEDGPEFDGHLVDFDEVARRQKIYATAEAKRQYRREHAHNEVAFEKEGC